MNWAAVLPAVLLGALFGRSLNLLAPALSTPLFSPDTPAAESRRKVRQALATTSRSVAAATLRTRSADVVAVRTPILELCTAVLFGLMVVRFGLSWALPAYLYLTAMAVLLATIDLQHQRLPNLVVLPSAAVGLILLTVAAVGSGFWNQLLRAFLGAVILFGLYLVLAIISPAGMGMGDVKLAGVLGLFLGYLGWRTLVLGAMGGFVLAALVGVVLLALRRVGRQTLIPFGPSMLLAALAAVLLHTG